MEKIGIIGAMDVEVSQLKAALLDPEPLKRARMDFVKGTLSGKPVVVVQSGVGKVNAGICGQILCDLGCDALVFTGVAGSLDARVGVLDLVVSTDCMYYDVDVQNLGYAPGEIPQMGIVSFPADALLREKALHAAQGIASHHHVFEGRVASGDRFVHEIQDKASIHSMSGALCCEMEGAAVAQACYLNAVPYVVIRAISDTADGSNPMAYPLFERKAARLCSRIISQMVAEL
jgi:adenosylhomocysteine nucleosidase